MATVTKMKFMAGSVSDHDSNTATFAPESSGLFASMVDSDTGQYNAALTGVSYQEGEE
jgi:hypothetical protein